MRPPTLNLTPLTHASPFRTHQLSCYSARVSVHKFFFCTPSKPLARPSPGASLHTRLQSSKPAHPPARASSCANFQFLHSCPRATKSPGASVHKRRACPLALTFLSFASRPCRQVDHSGLQLAHPRPLPLPATRFHRSTVYLELLIEIASLQRRCLARRYRNRNLNHGSADRCSEPLIGSRKIHAVYGSVEQLAEPGTQNNCESNSYAPTQVWLLWN